MITVKVKCSHLSIGQSAETAKIYRKGEIFTCTEEEFKRFRNSVEKIGEDPAIIQAAAQPAGKK